MKTIELKLSEIGLLAITRAALGAGLALLISTRLDDRQRRAVGLALTLVGVLTTIPFAMRLLADTD
jgi:hypothetical protein